MSLQPTPCSAKPALSAWRIVEGFHPISTQKSQIFKVYLEEKPDCFFSMEQYWPSTDLAAIKREFEIQRTLDHDNIAKVFYFYEPEGNQRARVIGEWIGDEDLKEYLQRTSLDLLPHSVVWYYFKQLISAIVYLDSRHITHRDLTLEAMRLDGSYNLKLTHFGDARLLMPGSTCSTCVGTVAYCAPEVLAGLPYTPKIDIWSAGIVLYAMLFRAYPFLRPHPSDARFSEFTSRANPFWAQLRATHPDLADLLSGMLQPDPGRRLTVGQVSTHPWLQTPPKGFADLPAHVRQVMAARRAARDQMPPTPPPHPLGERPSPVFV
ncbi:putative CAMK family protein kinase [Paratrimastix pyriformis]|uniref:CAMK family protein kinase n=1 Tax=Paratrimastix pyriformis TaxID=342808 RepID=A0ABQ8UGN9_9EUKA|nr:putative CAMK family protein kinase [Paratrimastix pyriformis]